MTKWFWIFLYFGLVLATTCQADEENELRDILGSGPEQKSADKASTTSAPTALNSSSNSNPKKLNIVVSSINDEGVKEEGHVGTEVSSESGEHPPSVEDKIQTKNNHVRSPLYIL
jgi:hypothetical protein